MNLPEVEPESEIVHLVQTLRDVALQAEKLGLSEAAHVLRQAQAAAEKAVTPDRPGSLN